MQRILILTMLLVFAVVSAGNAAVITLLNSDGAGEGFNDPAPAVPVGGNPGVTVGQQRWIAMQKAADIWGALLSSPVAIVAQVQFDPIDCTPTTVLLGFAGPGEVFANFVGAPLPDTWYPVALANKFSGVDLEPALSDIYATFNSDLNGNPDCFGGQTWYYGLDGNAGSQQEFLPVALHELSHGLGFLTLVSSTGEELGGMQDVYETYVHDNTLGLNWPDMTDAQRAASTINTGNLVWTGPCTTAHVPSFLGGTPTMFVNSGGPLPPTMPIGTASFGPATFSVTGELALVDDGIAPNTDACTPIGNGGVVSGRIAVIDRGSCTFASKAAHAQAVGAIGVVIINNVASSEPPGMGGTDPSITIPVVSVTLADGNAIKAALLGGPVNVLIGFDTAQLAGADASGRVKLYAPNPYEGGSSVSHFDVSALPNLLMEPFLSASLSTSVDLTLSAFIDIGWSDVCENPLAVAISGFSARVANGGVQLSARFYSTLDDANFVVVYRADGGSDDFRSITTVNAPGHGAFSYTDASVRPDKWYRYRISVIDGDGEFFSPVAEVRMPGVRYELSQNLPNPFNPTTTIRFSLPSSEVVALAIYNARGSLVRALVKGMTPQGTHNITWDGRDTSGDPVSSGVYFYKLTAGKFSESRKMVLLK